MSAGPARSLALATCLALAACETGPEVVFVRGATIIDGTGGPPVANGELLVVDGRISCVGPAGTCEPPERYDDVPASGFWVIPGLVDTHVHTFFDGDPDRSWRDERLRFLLGVTTSREASTALNHDGNVEAARRGADPRLPIPRLVVAGRIDAADAPDPASGAEAVRRLAESGAASIKLKDPFPATVLTEIAREARDRGFEVWGHAWAENPTRSLVREAIDGGFTGLAHLTGIAPLAVDDSVLAAPPSDAGEPAFLIWRRTLWAGADTAELYSAAREIAEAGVWLEPLLIVEEQWVEPYGLPPGLHRLAEIPMVVNRIRPPPGMPSRSEADLQRLAVSLERMRRFVHVFHEAGGVLVTGTDGSLAPGLSLQEEIKALARAGLSNHDALLAATSAAAMAAGTSDSLGTLEPGKLADFVVLEGDPIADLRNIELVSRVAKGGVLHDPATLFDQLKDDLGATASPATPRMLIGLLAVLAVVALTVIAIVRQGRSRRQAG